MTAITCRLVIIVTALTFSVFGCARVVTVEETYTSTGQKGYVIDCSWGSQIPISLCIIQHGQTAIPKLGQYAEVEDMRF